MLAGPRPSRDGIDRWTGPREFLWRALICLHGALLALASLHILSILVTGGYRYRVFGLRIHANDLALAVIILMVLVLAGYPLHRRQLRLRVFAGHEAGALAALCLIVYLANGSVQSSGDALPARYLPLSLLREGNLDLDEFEFLYRDATPYFISYVRGHYVSSYPAGAALLALPLYVPSALGTVRSSSDKFLGQLEKLAAAVIVALSVALVYLVARRLSTAAMALVVALVYALGSSSLSTSSQALWQHGASQLTLAATFYCLVRGRQQSGWVALAGFPLAFSIVCRPTNVLFALPMGLYVVFRHPRQVAAFVASALPPTIFQLWYNAAYFGDPLHTQFSFLDPGNWLTPTLIGLGGILISPARGLLIYSPVFILSVPGAVVAWCRGGDPLLRAMSVSVILSVALYSRWTMWWGGHSYGPRLLADLLPALALLLCPLYQWFSRPSARILLGVLASWSIFAHAAGVFWQDGRWNGFPEIDLNPHRLWSWSDNPLVNTITDISARVPAALGLRPTSRSDPALVVASYHIVSAPPRTAAPGNDIALALRVTNAGEATWISHARRGQIMLGWRWLAQSEPPPAPGLVPLNYDVAPRRSYEFALLLPAPRETGGHVLEAGLVLVTRGHVEWIVSDHPRVPLRFPIDVAWPVSSGITALLGPTAAVLPSARHHDGPPLPQAVIRLNRSQFEAGTELSLGVQIDNPKGSPRRQLYVGILLPDGRTAVFITESGTLTPPIIVSDHTRLAPMLTMEPGFTLHTPWLYASKIPSRAPAGLYELFIVITQEGALSKSQLAVGDIVSVKTLGFEVRQGNPH